MKAIGLVIAGLLLATFIWYLVGVSFGTGFGQGLASGRAECKKLQGGFN